MPPTLPGTTTLPLAPHIFWPAALLAALLLAILVVYVTLTAIGRKGSGPIWSFVEDLLPETNRRQALALGALVTVLFLAACVTALAILWHTAMSLTSHTLPSSEHTGLNLGAGALITALLGAPFVFWGAVLKHLTFRQHKDDAITDRISKAVEQLGAEKTVKLPKENGDGSTERTLPNIEVRIGAILSLERIAQDSTKHDKGRDHVRVMEILCAYIRENTPAKGAEPGPYDGLSGDEAIDQKMKISPDPWLETLPAPRADIQIALTVLGRRSQDQIKIEQAVKDKDGKPRPYKLDLRQTNLRLAVFDGGNFASAIFYRARLEGAYMNDGDFSDCDFTEAFLTKIGGSRATFDRANFALADLSRAVCYNASFKLCEFTLTHCVETLLIGSNLCFKRSSKGGLSNRAYMVQPILEHAIISGDMAGIHLRLRNFMDTEPGSNAPKFLRFRYATLGGHYTLLGFGKSWQSFPPAYLPLTFGDASVTLADEAKRPAHWPRWVLPDTGPHSYEAEYQRWLADPQGYTPPPPPG